MASEIIQEGQRWQVAFASAARRATRSPRSTPAPTPTGKRVRRFATFQGNRKDAEKQLTALLHLRDTGQDLLPDKMSTGEYLTRWLVDYAQHNVARSTFVRYKGIVEHHLIPKLGGVKLGDSRPAHVQASYGAFLSEGLSPRTVQQHHHVLREALQHGLKMQLVYRNVADAATAPRPERYEVKALSPEQVGALLDAVAGSDIEMLVTTALDTGARQGRLGAHLERHGP